MLGVLNAVEQAEESEENELYAEMVEEYLEQLIKRDFIGKLRMIIADLLPLVVDRTIKEQTRTTHEAAQVIQGKCINVRQFISSSFDFFNLPNLALMILNNVDVREDVYAVFNQ